MTLLAVLQHQGTELVIPLKLQLVRTLPSCLDHLRQDQHVIWILKIDKLVIFLNLIRMTTGIICLLLGADHQAGVELLKTEAELLRDEQDKHQST